MYAMLTQPALRTPDEEDIVDSDFGHSSDEEGGEGAAGAEDDEEAGERELQRQEKAARKVSW